MVSKWETVLREKGSGKFENTKVIQLVYKNRLYFRHSMKKETDRERLLMCYQTNLQIVNGRFPLTREFALELAALMAQVRKECRMCLLELERSNILGLSGAFLGSCSNISFLQ